jgi:hypothetical protein
MKINVDDAVARSNDLGVVAAICRISLGMYIGASALACSGTTGPAILEAIACGDVLALAEDLQINFYGSNRRN